MWITYRAWCSGEPVSEAAEAVAALGVQTLLFNCSQPEVIGDAIDAALATFKRLAVDISVGAYANAFPPQPKDATANDGLDELREDLDPPGYLHWTQNWRQRGASLLGGCWYRPGAYRAPGQATEVSRYASARQASSVLS